MKFKTSTANCKLESESTFQRIRAGTHSSQLLVDQRTNEGITEQFVAAEQGQLWLHRLHFGQNLLQMADRLLQSDVGSLQTLDDQLKHDERLIIIRDSKAKHC